MNHLLTPDPWMTVDTKTKPYIVEQLNNIKLSRSQYIATSIIKYGGYIENLFAMQNSNCKFYQQPMNILALGPLQKYSETIIPKYKKIPNGRY